MSDNFKALLDEVTEKSPRRIWAKPKGALHDCVKELKENHAFNHLGTITGLENGANFEVLYHLSQDKTGVLLTVRDTVPIENAKIKSISDLFISAAWYERELLDLLGIQIENLPPGNRYPLPDEWPADDHPLRKNWKPTEVK